MINEAWHGRIYQYERGWGGGRCDGGVTEVPGLVLRLTEQMLAEAGADWQLSYQFDTGRSLALTPAQRKSEKWKQSSSPDLSLPHRVITSDQIVEEQPQQFNENHSFNPSGNILQLQTIDSLCLQWQSPTTQTEECLNSSSR